MCCQSTDQQQSAPHQAGIVRQQIFRLVFRRDPTAYPSLLARWIHAVNPINPFVQQSSTHQQHYAIRLDHWVSGICAKASNRLDVQFWVAIHSLSSKGYDNNLKFKKLIHSRTQSRCQAEHRKQKHEHSTPTWIRHRSALSNLESPRADQA